MGVADVVANVAAAAAIGSASNSVGVILVVVPAAAAAMLHTTLTLNLIVFGKFFQKFMENMKNYCISRKLLDILYISYRKF